MHNLNRRLAEVFFIFFLLLFIVYITAGYFVTLKCVNNIFGVLKIKENNLQLLVPIRKQ
jgi:hypothetical protein